MAKGNLRSLLDHEVPKTDAECLIGIVDESRQLLTDFGLRPYRVFLVWIGWTADEDGDGRISSEPLVRDADQTDLTAFSEADLEDEVVGVGRPVVLREDEILPTPLVSSLTGIGKEQDALGLTERGSETVSQISARLSEDLLMGLVEPFLDPDRPGTLKRGVEFFWEIQQNRAAGHVSPGSFGIEDPQERRQPRRRFHVSGTPGLDQPGFQWEVTLARADGERGREGEVEVIG